MIRRLNALQSADRQILCILCQDHFMHYGKDMEVAKKLLLFFHGEGFCEELS